MVKTWKLVNRLVKNSRLKGLTSLDSFPTKNVNFEMQYLVTGSCKEYDLYVILKFESRTIIIIPKYGHICLSTPAIAEKCWNSGAIFTPKNRSQFSIIETDFWKKIWNLETICNNAPERFFRNLSSNWIYLASKLVKKRKIWRENFFLLNVCGFCREKNSESTDGQNLEIGQSVGQKQPFKGFDLVGQLSHQKC